MLKKFTLQKRKKARCVRRRPQDPAQVLPKPSVANKQKRPHSITLTSVYDSILEDLVFTAEIVGKRIRVKLDGSQLIKVHLDKNQQTTIEHKVDTFQSVYKKLTGREVTFEFPDPYF